MNLAHWHYFLAIEEDLLRLSRFVEFSKKNSSTFSLENARILMAATQEVDVLLKQICTKYGVILSRAKREENIANYRIQLGPKISPLSEIEVNFLISDITAQPYESWTKKTPDWWDANNKIKHERHNNYEKASLSNVLDAVAGLFLANLYFYGPKDDSAFSLPRPKLIFSDKVSTLTRPTAFSVNPMIIAGSAHYVLP